MNSYLGEYRQHGQSAVFWAANEDKRTGIDTEKIATYTHPLQHKKKNMHKIRLYIVFISIRASQKMLLVSTDLILCFCFHPIFSRWSFFFVCFFPFLFRCCCRLKRMHLADCVMDLRAEEKTSNSLRYGSIRRRSLTAIFSKPDISQCLQTGSLFPYWRVQMPTSGEGQPFNPFKNPPQHSYWNFIFRKKERKKGRDGTNTWKQQVTHCTRARPPS